MANVIKINGKDIKDVKATQDIADLKSDFANMEDFLHAERTATYSRNRIDPSKFTSGLLQSDGTIEDNYLRVTTDYIPVESDTTYRNCFWNEEQSKTTNNTLRYSLYYDAEKNIIGPGPTTATGTFTATDLAYVRLSIDASTSDVAMLLLGDTGTTSITAYIPYAESESVTYGKRYKVVANGDSITYGHRPYDEGYETMTNGVSYIHMACEAGGYDLDNYAISASTIALNTDGTDTHDALCARYQDMSDDADLVWIASGSNDWWYDQCEIGTMDDRTGTTFYGAMHVLCSGLKQKYGAIPIVFATPIKRWITRPNNNPPGDRNSHNEPMTDVVNAMKEVCAYYGIPVVDMYAESYLNPWVEYDRTHWVPDGTHPNKAGHERMEIECLATLRKYLPIIDKRVSV